VSEPLTLAELAEGRGVAERLETAGLHPKSVASKTDLFARCAEPLMQMDRRPGEHARAWFVPGRIEVLGKHTDYAGGRSLLAAAEYGFCMIALAREDAHVRVTADAGAETTQFELSPDLTPRKAHWSNYIMTAGRRLARNFGPSLRGIDLAFGSDLPPAAGMSSSSALLTGACLSLMTTNRIEQRDEYRRDIDGREDLAEYLGTVENGQTYGDLAGDRGVGTFGGSEDHTAILNCHAGELSQYAFCPVRQERRLALPRGFIFVVASSGVIAEKTGRAMELYNRASRLARAGVKAWNRATDRDDPHLAAAVRSAPDAPERMRKILAAAKHADFAGQQLLRRFEHFLTESEQIIPVAGDALVRGDMAAFGSQIKRSQELGETLLGNQVPETIDLAMLAGEKGFPASAFGAGFGGSVYALVPAESAEEFLTWWSHRYAEQFPDEALRSRFFLTRPGPAAFAL
jgi:galactokinase